MSAAKCETCEIYAEAQKCGVPSCCTWYMDNVVLRGIPVKFCTEYRPIGDKREKHKMNKNR